jgi:signal transduction histidine kinase
VHPDDRQAWRRRRSEWGSPEWQAARERRADAWLRQREQWRERRVNRRRPLLFAPVLIAAIQVIACSLAARGQPGATRLDALGYLLLVAGPAALLVRRTQPLLAAAVGLAAAVAYLAIGYPTGPFFLAALGALFAAVRRSRRELVWTLAAVAYASYVFLSFGPYTVDMRVPPRPGLGEVVVVGAWFAVALLLAETVRFRGGQMAEYARAQAEASRARQEQSRRQASDERLQIARELHDVLGHHLSLINVRAGVGLHLIDSRPEEARAALEAIKTASAEALHEVRGVLSALAPNDPERPSPAAPRTPTPGLADVSALADDARAAGLPVSVDITGRPTPVPAAVDRAAYRIVQEALTNVRRHAGPDARATVALGYADGELRIRVENSGAPLDSAAISADGGVDGAGNGIPGMRERATALGGTLTARARPEGGFQVDAVLPLNVRSGQSTGETQ